MGARELLLMWSDSERDQRLEAEVEGRLQEPVVLTANAASSPLLPVLKPAGNILGILQRVPAIRVSLALAVTEKETARRLQRQDAPEHFKVLAFHATRIPAPELAVMIPAPVE